MLALLASIMPLKLCVVQPTAAKRNTSRAASATNPQLVDFYFLEASYCLAESV